MVYEIFLCTADFIVIPCLKDVLVLIEITGEFCLADINSEFSAPQVQLLEKRVIWPAREKTTSSTMV
jgi:hypothetical protein